MRAMISTARSPWPSIASAMAAHGFGCRKMPAFSLRPGVYVDALMPGRVCWYAGVMILRPCRVSSFSCTDRMARAARAGDAKPAMTAHAWV